MAGSFLSDYAFNTTVSTAVEQLTKGSSYDDYFFFTLLAFGASAYLGRGTFWDKPDPYHYKWFERPQQTGANADLNRSQTRDVAQKLEETQHDLVIFWGSQSGTAEGFAYRLARDCQRRFKLKALVADVSDYDNESIALIPSSKFAIFIMSTYGEGDPSDNSADFHRWLKSAPSSPLGNLKYAAFGLGNTNYKYYNAVIDLVVESLDKMGASSILPVGKANEATGTTEEDFLSWKEALFKTFTTQFALPEYQPEYEPSIQIVEDDSLSDNPSGLYLGEPQAKAIGSKTTASISPIGALPIKEVRELTTTSSANVGRQCVHLELDLKSMPTIKYKTGDHIAVWPVNPNQEVSRLLSVLDLEKQKDIPVLLSSLDPANKLKLPSPTTLQALFQHYLEICAPVSRETVASLAQFAPTPTVKSNLVTLSASKETYTSYLENNHITLARLLELTTASDSSARWQLPTSFVLESLQPMTPRYYSISSSSIISPRQVSITVAVNPAPLPSSPSTTIPGLASTYISSFQTTASADSSSLSPPLYPSITSSSSEPTPAIHAHIRRSTFKLPASASTPLIMVANGTGIAPFRAFLHERARFASIGKSVAPMTLFFGCRHPEQDYLYKTEIEELQQGPLSGCLEVINAFSRLDDGRKKVYVQDRVEETKERIGRSMLDEDAVLYICGAAAMAREVGRRVGEAVQQIKGWDDEGLKVWKEGRKRTRRWQEDVWG